MLNYSFYSRDEKHPNTKEDAIVLLANTKKPIKYTHGYKWKCPTTYKIPITPESAVKIVAEESLVDVEEFDDYIDVNTYSGNDMW